MSSPGLVRSPKRAPFTFSRDLAFFEVERALVFFVFFLFFLSFGCLLSLVLLFSHPFIYEWSFDMYFAANMFNFNKWSFYDFVTVGALCNLHEGSLNCLISLPVYLD